MPSAAIVLQNDGWGKLDIPDPGHPRVEKVAYNVGEQRFKYCFHDFDTL